MLVALFAAVGWTLAPQVGPRPEGLMENIHREVPNASRLPEGRYRLLQEWEAEGPFFGHRIGRRVEDADAGGGAAWEAGVGRDAPHAHALFGPYADTPAGDYVAFFRIKLLDEPVRDFAAEVDACVEYGRRVLNSLEVADVDLVRDKYVQVPLAFRSPGGKLECRVLWWGNVSLRIDKVTLFRIEGAPIEQLIHRAPPPIPSGEPKELPYRVEPKVGGEAVARQVPLALERLAQEEFMEPLPKGVALRFVAEFEAEQLAHISGEAEKEEAASGGVAWVARRGRAQPGHIVYGPYLPVGEGRYLALFRLKRLGEGEGILAVVDSCVGGGKPVTAERRVRASELPKGEFRLVPLPFTHPGGPVETRVLWTGQADLAVDRVTLWETLPQP